ncbi:sterol desaturase family protein [Leptospira kanakyensis]|uniref:Sterol desaturase family protein n=1 Tax=Leptospira kanakyensis TaxID=2484968 RepID=A0A6N4Q5V7_9LEPT|nr:sterol desaturase family protein [Leptospira kanakyensis]MCW7471604.1 sterol desaturase family protein [Leptospira kanakyensis]MCW7481256.1 sterol desaturase family protein [Leptospira kanakyensis]TGK46108.1 sterol desaturase family protein [Leptospira kanakyensis]TGK65045.1 sterol desaturase family protein [Leptospira kanakyensis]TGK65477.1 sterol desaturase family protein [Leptospira kanakyensis]
MFENFTPPPIVTYAIPVFFLLIGIEVYIGYRKNKALYRLNDSIADLSTGIISQIWGLFQKGIGLFAYFYIYEHFRFFEFALTNPWAWVLCIVGQDFCYYWSHRLAHEVNILWAGHVIHHHSEEYNLVVALRQTGLGGIVSWIFYVPLALIGFHPWMYLASGQINLIYQFWVHTKAVGKIGKIGEYLLSTPSHHRVHHAINPIYIDKNHGGIFIIFDRMFGTFREETEPCVYGTVKPLRSFNPVYANIHYYWELIKQAASAPYFLDKIKVFFKPPGWYPRESSKPAGFLPIPEVSPATFHKYDPKPGPEVRTYTTTWFVLVLLLSFAFLLFVGKFALVSQILVTVWVTLSLLAINALIEGKSWAGAMEITRLLFGFLVIAYFGVTWHYYAIGIVCLLVAGIYLYRTSGQKAQAA